MKTVNSYTHQTILKPHLDFLYQFQFRLTGGIKEKVTIEYDKQESVGFGTRHVDVSSGKTDRYYDLNRAWCTDVNKKGGASERYSSIVGAGWPVMVTIDKASYEVADLPINMLLSSLPKGTISQGFSKK